MHDNEKSFFSQNLFWCLLNFWQNMSSSRSRLLAINYICIQQQRPVVRYRKCYTTCNPYKSFMASGQILASTFSYKCVIKFNNKIYVFSKIFSLSNIQSWQGKSEIIFITLSTFTFSYAGCALLFLRKINSPKIYLYKCVLSPEMNFLINVAIWGFCCRPRLSAIRGYKFSSRHKKSAKVSLSVLH